MPEFRERDGDEHDFSRQNVERHYRIIIKPLMICKVACQERGGCNQHDEIVIDGRDGPDPR